MASKPNDRIFLYYSDHGGPGVLGEFPTCFNTYCYASNFMFGQIYFFFKATLLGLLLFLDGIQIEENLVKSRVRPHQFSM